MKRWLLAHTLALAFAAAAPHALAQHVHGAGKLDVSIDAQRVTIALDAPLESLLGFERAPRTDRERASARAVLARLTAADTLFSLTPAAQCTLAQAPTVVSSVDLSGDKPATSSAAAKKSDDHADLQADFVFRCANPAALNRIEVKLFEAFTGLKRLDAQLVHPKGQRAATLNAKNRTLTW